VVGVEVQNARSGPGTNYPVVGQVKQGDELQIVARGPRGAWWQVCCVNGQQVWLYGELVQANRIPEEVPVATDIPTPPPTPTPAPMAVAAVAMVPGFFDYGVQASVIDNGQVGNAMRLTQDMGFHWVKVQIPWKRFEKARGQIEWGPLDEIVNVASAHGLRLLFSVVKAPDWARPADTDFGVEGPPANPQDYANFMGALASRYRGRVQAYEIWNEQNLWYEWGGRGHRLSASGYVNLLQVAYHAIKAQDPAVIVVSGAPTPTGWNDGDTAIDDAIYLEQMYQAELKHFCDAVGAHGATGSNIPPDADPATYQDPGAIFRGPWDTPHHSWSFQALMHKYRNIMTRYGDSQKRVWVTEFGWAVFDNPPPDRMYARDNTYDEQIAWTIQAYQLGRSWGWVGVMFLWNLNFAVTDPGTELEMWSIVDHHGNPLPLYSALRAARSDGRLP